MLHVVVVKGNRSMTSKEGKFFFSKAERLIIAGAEIHI